MNLVHWRHFLALERELLEIAQYIEICESNFHVHSVKFSHLLMASASEFETVGNMVRDKLRVSGTGINSILDSIDHLGNPFKLTEINIPLYQLKIKPLEGCAPQNPPSWWKAYNKIKHKRATNFKMANLENSLQSMCGLLIILAKHYCLENNSTHITSSVLNGSIGLLQLPSSYYHEW